LNLSIVKDSLFPLLSIYLHGSSSFPFLFLSSLSFIFPNVHYFPYLFPLLSVSMLFLFLSSSLPSLDLLLAGLAMIFLSYLPSLLWINDIPLPPCRFIKSFPSYFPSVLGLMIFHFLLAALSIIFLSYLPSLLWINDIPLPPCCSINDIPLLPSFSSMDQ
jgi:hypothetical protein